MKTEPESLVATIAKPRLLISLLIAFVATAALICLPSYSFIQRCIREKTIHPDKKEREEQKAAEEEKAAREKERKKKEEEEAGRKKQAEKQAKEQQRAEMTKAVETNYANKPRGNAEKQNTTPAPAEQQTAPAQQQDASNQLGEAGINLETL